MDLSFYMIEKANFQIRICVSSFSQLPQGFHSVAQGLNSVGGKEQYMGMMLSLLF